MLYGLCPHLQCNRRCYGRRGRLGNSRRDSGYRRNGERNIKILLPCKCVSIGCEYFTKRDATTPRLYPEEPQKNCGKREEQYKERENAKESCEQCKERTEGCREKSLLQLLVRRRHRSCFYAHRGLRLCNVLVSIGVTERKHDRIRSRCRIGV